MSFPGLAVPRVRVMLVILGMAVAALCGVTLAVRFRDGGSPPRGVTGFRQTEPPPFPDAFELRTPSAPLTARGHLLDGSFTVVKHVGEIDGVCRDAFYRAFLNINTHGPVRGVAIADPGQPFQETDVSLPGHPFQRLVMAGLVEQSCFIYYQHGGAAGPRFCLVVIERRPGKVVWAGWSPRKAQGIEGLRQMLPTEDFCYADRSGC